MTPPQIFALSSLILIVATAITISLTQSFFYRDEIIERESVIIHDIVNAIVIDDLSKKELSLTDMVEYGDPVRQGHLERSFKALKNLSDVTLIKVYDTNRKVVWSDDPLLIGTEASFHPPELTRALNGEVRPVLIPEDNPYLPIQGLPFTSMIEFYVPFSMDDPAAASRKVSGVAALYRLPNELNDTIRHGLILFWLVTGIGGAVLFALMFKLFQSVYQRQQEVESRMLKLSAEHQHMIQIERLSALGQMVSEIAHQLNNPLVGVVNLAELAELETNDPARVRELLGDVRKAGEHCRDFVQRMLQFNEVAKSQPQTVEISDLVRETITFFQQSMAGHPVVSVEAPGDRCILDVDPVLIRHALFNLIHNAALAMPEGPVVVSIAPDERRGIAGYRISVSDRGPGLKPDVAAKLFTPFFTTRPSGTGLGLSVAQHIVVMHGGSIHGENQPGGGARFIIWLPASR